MKELVNEYKEKVKDIFQDKKILVSLIVVTILSFGFCLANSSMGVDDTAIDRYTLGTYALSANRWGTWLVYNILGIHKFSAFWLDFLTVLVLFFTAILYIAFVQKITNSKLKKSSYILLGTAFISFPIINNFFVYQPTNLTVSLSNLLILFQIIYIYNRFCK